MAEGGVTRKLAAILAADVVGFSRLMSADEVGALALVTAHLDEVVRPAVEAHQGRIFKTMGDGFLVEFASAVEAVECAVRIQRAMAERSGDVAEERRAIFRIGINLGDVIVQGDDVFGDGVNVAARIEALTDPGGVFISRSVHDQIARKCDFPFEDMGEHEVKNIPQPVHVFRVVTDPSAAPVKRIASAPEKQKRRWLARVATLTVVAALGAVAVGWFWVPEEGTKVERAAAISEAPSNEISPLTNSQLAPEAIDHTRPSVAVLPFDNLSGDPEQQYFSDGMTEDLITRLAKMSGMVVIARNSSFAVKNQFVDVREIGQVLGVRFVVEGSVRRSQDRLRITAQLIDTKTGQHLWAEHYDREKGDVFAVQDEVVERIVTALKITLTPEDKASLDHSFTDNLEAYDWFLRGIEQHSRLNETGNDAAIEYFNRAISLDSRFARAYAFLAWAHARAYLFDWTDRPDEDLAKGYELAQKAVELDGSIHNGYFVLGMVELYRRDHAKAIAALKHAVELVPDNPDILMMLAFTLNYAGIPERAVDLVEKGMRLNPFHSYLYNNTLGMARFSLGQFDLAISDFTKALERNPEDHQARLWMISALAHADRMEDARWQVEELLVQAPDFSLAAVEQRQPFKSPQQLNRLIDGLRKAGLGD